MTMDVDTRPVGARRSAGAVYYRKPNGWISWGGYDDVIKEFMDRRWQVMLEYGRITALLRDSEGNEYDDPATVWGPILRHPKGPAEFPVSQIIELRWYKEADCPVPGTRFPQLRGVKVTEHACPQCTRAPFVSAVNENGEPVTDSDGVMGLSNHLTITHSWDRQSLTTYGERADIDFNSVGAGRSGTKELGFDEPEPATEPVQVAPDFEVEAGTTVEVTEAAIGLKCECGYEPREDSKNKQASMQTHKNLQCPLRADA